MIWIVSIAAAIVGVIVYEVCSAPEVSDDYEIKLWEKYRRERYDEALPPVDKPLRHPDAA